MSLHVECPSCGRDLVVSKSAREYGLTCPRCLAEVPVPDDAGRPDAVQSDRPERRTDGPSCPSCGRNVEAVWVSCPWCEEPLRGRADRRYGRPDLDVRRDRKSTGVVVIILAVLGAIGVAILFFAAVGTPQLLVNLVVGLCFLVGLTTLIVFLRTGGNPGADGFRRVVVGTLAMVGGVIVLGIAWFTFLFVVCIAVIAAASHH